MSRSPLLEMLGICRTVLSWICCSDLILSVEWTGIK